MVRCQGHEFGTVMTAALDLFSGLGGMALALSGIVTPIAYCDVCPASRAVLEARMEEGRLPKAPICGDVRALNTGWLDRMTTIGTAPKVIMAGFPCVGFSSLGSRTAFEDVNRSGLFFEVLRIVDELRPPVLFLENVPGVLTMGMTTIVEELSAHRGYDLTWCVLAASDMGAPHRRRRWFCLATLLTADPDLLPTLMSDASAAAYESYHSRWTTRGEGVPRMVVLDSKHSGCMGCGRGGPEPRSPGASRRVRLNTRRHELLGNSVVPDAVRHAFIYLVKDCMATRVVTPSARTKWPMCGRYIASSASLQRHDDLPSALPNQDPRPLVLVPSSFVGIARSDADPLLHNSPAVTCDVVLTEWATPRFHCPRPSCRLTRRTLRDLPTQLRFERDTPHDVRKGHVAPEFVEWMMGYPIGWTLATIGAGPNSV